MNGEGNGPLEMEATAAAGAEDEDDDDDVDGSASRKGEVVAGVEDEVEGFSAEEGGFRDADPDDDQVAEKAGPARSGSSGVDAKR